MQQPWYNNAVFYSLDVDTFYDSNGDGTGDLQGLIHKLEYIAGLGATCLWLLPFYPSPNRDNGYDVSDYYNVDPRLDTLGDFAELLHKAEQVGLRIIIDLVVNHTSVEHSWFQQARKSRTSPYRNFYVWSDEPQPFGKEHLLLKGEEASIWTYDDEAGQYYLHHFYKEQPDLNIGHPQVQEEILKVMGFWLRLGVSGFRIDAAKLLVEPYGQPGGSKEALLLFLNRMRSFVQRQRADALLLAEVNLRPDEMLPYLENNSRMNMLFNFYVNQHLFLALATEGKAPLEKALKKLPVMHPHTAWLQFLRHHDELSLELLPKESQQQVLDAFAPKKEMRIYETGIRRRLSPMMAANPKKLQLAYSLLFSMPGAVVLRYGDEIGMGYNLRLEGRQSVRTPMQWSGADAGGFSTAAADRLVQPVISGGKFGYQKTNVLAAQQAPASLLNWLERLITTRKQCPEIGSGELSVIAHANKTVLIHLYRWKEKKLYCLHNLSGKAQAVTIKGLEGENFYPVFGRADKKGNKVALTAYGYCWLCNRK